VIALATCASFPDLDADDRLLLDALRARGVHAVPAVWDDPSVDWARFALTVIRSTWNYVERRQDFLAWAAAVPRLANPEPVLRWNTDKRYLADLEEAGVATVPTLFVEPDQDVVVGLPHAGLVVKPAVSAGSRDTERHRAIRPALEHVAALGDAGRVAMVQPYLEAVDRHGETALIHVDGAFSHAARKGAMLTGDRVAAGGGLFQAERIEPAEPTAGERAAADAVLAVVADRFGAPPLYARVDLLPGPDGAPMVLEVELTEPSLFLAHAPGAPQRLAEAIASRVGDQRHRSTTMTRRFLS
jgi:hypothetical protein